MHEEKICSVEGCKNPIFSKGLCNTHYLRWKRTGSIDRKTKKQPLTCSVDGCEREPRSLGMCIKHWKRWKKYGSTDKEILQRPWAVGNESSYEYFNRKTVKNEENNCIEWIGWRDKDGYGGAYRNGKNIRAHRFSYELFIGPIPKGKNVCHKCDNPSCVNPDHLYVGTQRDNMYDKVERDRCNLKCGEEAKVSRLTEAQVVEIIREKKSGTKVQRIIDKYAISKSTIMDIMQGKLWKHIDRDSIEPYKQPKKDSIGRTVGNKFVKLTEKDVKDIKQKLMNNEKLKSVAEEFGVSGVFISKIRDEKVWKHIPWPTKRKRKVKRRRKLC